MAPNKIETPREFFDHVASVDVQEFKTRSTDLRCAYHACTALLSLRDWVLHQHRRTPWADKGVAQTPFNGTTQLQSALNTIDPRCKIVTDIANASKHMVLDPKRSQTALWGNANTEVQHVHGGAIGSGPIGAAPIGGTSSRIVVKIGNNFHDVLDAVSAVHAVWDRLMTQNSW